MKVSDVWTQYQSYTKDLTEQTRKLSFAIAAICWFFKSEQATFPNLVLLSLGSVVLFLVLDVVQSLTAATRRKTFARSEEEERWAAKEDWDDIDSNDFEVEVPATLDKPVFTLFVLKLVALAFASAFLISEFAVRLAST